MHVAYAVDRSQGLTKSVGSLAYLVFSKLVDIEALNCFTKISLVVEGSNQICEIVFDNVLGQSHKSILL